MKIEKDTLQKIPFVGSYIGVKEIAAGKKSLNNLSSKNKAHLFATERFEQMAEEKQAKHRILRGVISLFPFVGGAILAVYDKCFKNATSLSNIPFPDIFTEKRQEVRQQCEALRSLTLINDIFSLKDIQSRIDDIFEAEIIKQHHLLSEAIAKIPNTNDSEELKQLKLAWVESLGTLDADILAKLNFTPQNIQDLGYSILQNAWLKTIENSTFGNERIEVTRNAPGFSDISMAACFSVFAMFKELKDKRGHVIRHIQLIQSPQFSDLCSKSLANLLSRNRKGLLYFDFNGLNITPEQAKNIAKGLKYNNGIHYLRLTNNKIGDEGAIQLFESLQTALKKPSHSDIIIIEFIKCGLTDKSLPYLYNLLKMSSKKNGLSVRLMDNDYTEEARQQIKEQIDKLNLERPKGKKINLR